MTKSLETVGRVTHTHTHTQAFLDNEIASNSKAFNVPINERRNLKFNCILMTVILGFFLYLGKGGNDETKIKYKRT